MSTQANQRELPSPPLDAISALQYSPTTSTRLLVSSWDKGVHLYDTHAGEGNVGARLQKWEHAGPVLDTCYGANDTEVFSAGLDWTVNKLDPETGKVQTIATHEQPVKAVCWNNDANVLASGSWSATLSLHDPRAGTPAASYPQPHKIYALSTVGTTLVVGMAQRTIHLYDIRSPGTPLQRRESSLKFQTRTLRCMPNGQGYASSSIEGRVAVEFFDPSDESQARKYAFKCHRQVEKPTDGGVGVDVVYPVNALAFHPVWGTFASGGGDGVVSLWDGMAKRRLRQYQRFPASVAAVGFDKEGGHLAVASSGGFEDGRDDGACPEETVRVFVRELAPGEGKGKGQ